MKWSSWLQAGTTKKVHVKVKPLKLEGLSCNKCKVRDGRERAVVVKMKWKGPKSGLGPFYRVSTCQRSYSSQKFLKDGECIEWDGDEFESVCDFWISSKDKSFVQWDVAFSVLYGDQDVKSRTKLMELGNVSLNIAELATKTDSQIERKLPVAMQIDGVASQATLLISLSFAEVRNSCDPPGIVQNSAESDTKQGFFKGITASNKKEDKVNQATFSDSDESSMFESDGLPGTESTPSSEGSNAGMSPGAELGSSPRSGRRTHSDSIPRVGLFSWKKRRLSFSLPTRKTEPSIEKTVAKNDNVESNIVDLQKSFWEVKRLVSRDGKMKLEAKMFFASFDQRSEKAAGESACAAIVAVIADWLHSNQHSMPTSLQFDSLITEGSSEWRKLCDNDAYMNFFPDNHFDLETVLKTDLRPLTILHEKSFTGIFSPEKFENLNGATSFDHIWEEINRNTKHVVGQDIYIVSWNDHFFVLKVEADAYYIIDSLGERLFEGFKQAYILKFDESSLMYGKVAKEKVASEEIAKAEKVKNEEESEEIICKGKECCKEYMKRFLAAIPLGELEDEEKKETVSTFSLLKRLQIDFHYCSSSCASSSSSLTSSASPLFSGEEYAI